MIEWPLFLLLFSLFLRFHPFFHIFLSVVYFSHRRSAWIQKVVEQSVILEPKNLRSYTFLDPIGHFGFYGANLQAISEFFRHGKAVFKFIAVYVLFLHS